MNDSFNWEIYLALNDDLRTAGIITQKKLLSHWRRFGINEKRSHAIEQVNPDYNWVEYKNSNIELNFKNKSECDLHWVNNVLRKNNNEINKESIVLSFNWKIYMAINSDIMASGIMTEQKAIAHFKKFGKAENRKYHIKQVAPNFDYKMYSRLNPDLDVFGFLTQEDYELHWIIVGMHEKRLYVNPKYELDMVRIGNIKNLPDGTIDNSFNWLIYYELHADLSKHNINTKVKIMNHWYKHGTKENRKHTITDAYPNFDHNIYKRLNPDLEEAGLLTKQDYEMHWLKYGRNENRAYCCKIQSNAHKIMQLKLIIPYIVIPSTAIATPIKKEINKEIVQKMNVKVTLLYKACDAYNKAVSVIDMMRNQIFNDYEFIIIDDTKTFDMKSNYVANLNNNKIRIINGQNEDIISMLKKYIGLANGSYISVILDDINYTRNYIGNLYLSKCNLIIENHNKNASFLETISLFVMWDVTYLTNILKNEFSNSKIGYYDLIKYSINNTKSIHYIPETKTMKNMNKACVINPTLKRLIDDYYEMYQNKLFMIIDNVPYDKILYRYKMLYGALNNNVKIYAYFCDSDDDMNDYYYDSINNVHVISNNLLISVCDIFKNRLVNMYCNGSITKEICKYSDNFYKNIYDIVFNNENANQPLNNDIDLYICENMETKKLNGPDNIINISTIYNDAFKLARDKILPRPIEIPYSTKEICVYYGPIDILELNTIKQFADKDSYVLLIISDNPTDNLIDVSAKLPNIDDVLIDHETDILNTHKNILYIGYRSLDDAIKYISWASFYIMPLMSAMCKDSNMTIREIELTYANKKCLYSSLLTYKQVYNYNDNIKYFKYVILENTINSEIDDFLKNNNLANINQLHSLYFSSIGNDDQLMSFSETLKMNNSFHKNICDNFRTKIKESLDNRINNIDTHTTFDIGASIYDLNYKYYSHVNKKISTQMQFKKPTIILFPIISYNTRIQRHQHICRMLGERGYQVFYIRTESTKQNDINDKRINNNLYEATLLTNTNPINIYNDMIDEKTVQNAINNIKKLREKYKFDYFVSIITNAFWYRIVKSILNTSVIYDCVDYHHGFGNISNDVSKLESILVEKCDKLVMTSPVLANMLKIPSNKYTLIRNGCEFDYFDRIKKTNGKVIGYYGAIADWFDDDIVRHIAVNYPDYEIHLIGNVYCINNAKTMRIKELSKLSNVKFFGEIPYSELHKYINKFTIGIIPFVLNDLIKCTNPVKLYEMLALGIPIVMSALPDVLTFKDGSSNLYYLSANSDHFVKNIRLAINENYAHIALNRKRYAKTNDWRYRVNEFEKIIQEVTPAVSIVLLCWNHWTETKRCLDSILINSKYDNYEVIVTDNYSTDETRRELERYRSNNKVKIQLNAENYGFAKGMNLGAIRASGDYVVLLNNDTVCGNEWIFPLVKPLIKNENYGFGSPATNNCGNEGKQFIYYTSIDEFLRRAKKLQILNNNEHEFIFNAPFFGPVCRKKDLYSVGLLDINFGRGGWEDDDINHRMRLYGKDKNYFTYGSFVYHMESLSLGPEHYVNNPNKTYYENKWNIKWMPPKYKFYNLNYNVQTKSKFINDKLESLQRYNPVNKYSMKGLLIKDINDTTTGNKMLILEKETDDELYFVYKNNKIVLDKKKGFIELYKLVFTVYNDII